MNRTINLGTVKKVEVFDEAGSTLMFGDAGPASLKKYRWRSIAGNDAPAPLYLGHSLSEVMASGRDILAEECLRNGAPSSCASVDGILPLPDAGAFGYISGVASWNGVIITRRGALVPQASRLSQNESEVFSPTVVDLALGSLTPGIFWLDGSLPVVLCVFRGEERFMEITYACEVGDTGRDPIVWIRAQILSTNSFEVLKEEYYACARQWGQHLRGIEPQEYWYAFDTACLHWLQYREQFAEISIPDKELETSVDGCMMAVRITFTDSHPHYGHAAYGLDYHDHFPPNFLTAFEAFATLGDRAFAEQIVEYVFRCVIDTDGQFCYRQGVKLRNGSSASEYGQFLWLLERYEKAIYPRIDLGDPFYLEKMASIGDTLIRSRQPCREFPDLSLVQMCAEADTNGRVYCYVQNGWWAYRGLSALARVLERHGRPAEKYLRAADAILRDTNEAAARSAVSSRFGKLLPFRIGYTAEPLTLSNCRETFVPVNDQELLDYFQVSDMRTMVPASQDYTENTYANYRYYPEMLSACCMSKAEEDALVKMREQLGGESLGMTRFYDHLDDWPVYNYARFLLETDRTQKYLLLLFAHARYHGLQSCLSYYEQVGFNGRVFAADCVPSTLIVPLMVSWMIAFEPVREEALYLLRGVPKAWYRQGFTFRDIRTRWGSASISVAPDGQALVFDMGIPGGIDSFYLDVRSDDADGVLAGEGFAIVSTQRIDEGLRLLIRPESDRLMLAFAPSHG